jgi:hypothetical protein
MTTAITANRQALATINRIARVGSGAALGSGAEATAFKEGLAKPRCACGASLRWTLVSEYVAVAGATHSGGLMDKRFWISGIVLTIVWMILAYIVNWVLLKTQFDMTNLFRSDAEQMRHVGWLVLADLLIGFSLTWIYRQGNTTAPVLGQGLRFGIAVAALAVVPMCLTYYAVQPMPGALVVKQIVLDVISALIMGVLVAWLNPRATTA